MFHQDLSYETIKVGLKRPDSVTLEVWVAAGLGCDTSDTISLYRVHATSEPSKVAELAGGNI